MEKKLTLEIITPREIKYSGEIKLLVTPGPLSSLGILPDHISLLTSIESGEIMLRLPDNREIFFAISEGILEVDLNHLSLLVEYAREADEIDFEREKELLAQALSDLSECNNQESRDKLKKDIKYINTKLNVVNKQSAISSQ